MRVEGNVFSMYVQFSNDTLLFGSAWMGLLCVGSSKNLASCLPYGLFEWRVYCRDWMRWGGRGDPNSYDEMQETSNV